MLECYGRNGGPVHREGCGIPQNGTPRDTVHLHCRPPPASTGYCSSTVDLLQPPPATVHPRAPIHLASTARYSTGYCSTSPLHGLLFNHPSTGYCSSSPPPSTVHPALHGVVLFIQPQPARLIGVMLIQRQHHGVLFIHPHRELFIQTPQQRSLFIQRQRHGVLFIHPHQELFIQTPPPSNAHWSSRGSIDRLQLASVAKESLDRFS